MITLSFDAIIIGTGQAGPSLAARLAAEGKQVAILEKPCLAAHPTVSSPSRCRSTQPSPSCCQRSCNRYAR